MVPLSRDALQLPRPFGPYTLLRRLAVGGMAEVYVAKAKGIGGFEKLVAIKVIHPRYSEDEHFVQMLVEEAKLSVLLSHVNIAQTFDLGCVDDTYFIIMEFIDGADAYGLLKRASEQRARVPVDLCAYIASEVCHALDYAHRKRDPTGAPLNIVHRDISPQNVLISFAGEVKIVDFGIAKAALRTAQTEVGVIKGKYYYMSPEQAWADPVDHRSDIFSAGIVLHELLTGEMVYQEDNLPTLLDAVRKAEIRPPSKVRPGIPDELDRIVMKSLANRPEDRYQSAHDFGQALTQFLYQHLPSFTPARLSAMMGQLYPEELQRATGATKLPSGDDQILSSIDKLREEVTKTGANGEIMRPDEFLPQEKSVIFQMEDEFEDATSRDVRHRTEPAPQDVVDDSPEDDDDDEATYVQPKEQQSASGPGWDDQTQKASRAEEVAKIAQMVGKKREASASLAPAVSPAASPEEEADQTWDDATLVEGDTQSPADVVAKLNQQAADRAAQQSRAQQASRVAQRSRAAVPQRGSSAGPQPKQQAPASRIKASPPPKRTPPKRTPPKRTPPKRTPPKRTSKRPPPPPPLSAVARRLSSRPPPRKRPSFKPIEEMEGVTEPEGVVPTNFDEARTRPHSPESAQPGHAPQLAPHSAGPHSVQTPQDLYQQVQQPQAIPQQAIPQAALYPAQPTSQAPMGPVSDTDKYPASESIPGLTPSSPPSSSVPWESVHPKAEHNPFSQSQRPSSWPGVFSDAQTATNPISTSEPPQDEYDPFSDPGLRPPDPYSLPETIPASADTYKLPAIQADDPRRKWLIGVGAVAALFILGGILVRLIIGGGDKPGGLQVVSFPPGAYVTLNGVALEGTTPLSSTEELEVGRRYELRVSKEGYNDWRTSFEPAPGVVSEIIAVLESNQRDITVRTEPEAAAIFLDGVLQEGRGTVQLNLRLGRTYRVEARVGERRVSREITVSAATEPTLVLSLDEAR